MDNAFGYIEENSTDIKDWKKEFILNFAEWLVNDKQEYYGDYKLDYEFEINMEVFLGKFRPSYSRRNKK